MTVRPKPFHLISCVLFAVLSGTLVAADPCQSGLQPGQRPGPYSAVLSTGPQRGQSYCYICETADHPAAVVFARTLTDSLGKLVHELDKAVAEHRAADLRAWVTFLGEDQPSLDPHLVRWSQKHALRQVSLGVFEDAGGPPSYRLAREADVTVLLFVKQKVVANFAFRSGALTDQQITEVCHTVPRILLEKK